MSLSKLIITRILRDGHVTLTQLEHRAPERGVLLSDLYSALDAVHRDKRIKRGVRGGEVYYEPAPAPKAPIDHLKWVRENYPPMTLENDGSGIDIDLSWLFLKTKEERDEFCAMMKGTPTYVSKKRKQYTT